MKIYSSKKFDQCFFFQFNFVGKLLGPKGNSLKRMQEETLTKMAVLGRGSMRDKEKEEEMRKSGDPKYSHLQVNDKEEEKMRKSGDPKYSHLQVNDRRRRR